MRRKFLLVLISAFFSTALSLHAVEGLFQVNTVFQRTSYPLYGSSGKDVIRITSAGIALKSTRGTGLQGVIDIAILFPYDFEEKFYPAEDFSDANLDGLPLALDGVIGIGYRISRDPMIFFISGGFHTGALFEGGDSLAAFGVGIDAQSHVKLGEILTAQVGLKFAMDFGGVQTFISGSNDFAGFPITLGFYTGIGLSY